MKIRKGFVSNSSSSSFVVFGVEFEKEDAKNMMTEEEFIDFVEWDALNGFPEEIREFIHVCSEPYAESFWFGFHPELFYKNEEMTYKEIKEKVEKLYKKYFPNNEFELRYIELAWR